MFFKGKEEKSLTHKDNTTNTFIPILALYF